MRNKLVWVTFWIVGTSVFSIQELFNKHRFASFADGEETIVYMISDNDYNYVVISIKKTKMDCRILVFGALL
jgi:hypothetical protein